MSQKQPTNKPAQEQLEQAGFTTFGALPVYDPHLKKWRVIMLAGKADGTVNAMLAPDIMKDENEARLNALVVKLRFTKKGKKRG